MIRILAYLSLFALATPALGRGDDLSHGIGLPGGSGPYPAIAEAHTDAPGHTIYRPAQPPRQPLPLVLWGNGGCRDNGLSASHFLREIASHGYVVVANGSPREERPVTAALSAAEVPAPGAPPPRSTPDETSVNQYLAAIDWAARNSRIGALRIDVSRIAAMGHSCGGLQAIAAGADPRIDTVAVFGSGVYNRPGSGLSGVNVIKDDLRKLRGPIGYFIGGTGDIAYPNAQDDVDRIAHVPVFEGNLPVGHGGTFQLANGGDWGRVATAWLDWQLKRDKGAGRWFVGRDCRLCTTFGWTIRRKQFPEYP